MRKRELFDAPHRPLQDWVAAIHRDKPALVDIAGGEPLLWGWVPELIAACPKTSFGLSTNGLCTEEIGHLCGSYLPNLVSTNVSYHPEQKGKDRTWKRSVMLLKHTGFTIHTNIVDYYSNLELSEGIRKWLLDREIRCVVSPYERMDVLGEQLEQGLCCQGGINHLTIAPDGSAWPCLTTLRSPFWKQACLGNWLDDTVDVGRKKQPCHLNCVDYYVLTEQHSSGDMWGIEARPYEEPMP